MQDFFLYFYIFSSVLHQSVKITEALDDFSMEKKANETIRKFEDVSKKIIDEKREKLCLA